TPLNMVRKQLIRILPTSLKQATKRMLKRVDGDPFSPLVPRPGGPYLNAMNSETNPNLTPGEGSALPDDAETRQTEPSSDQTPEAEPSVEQLTRERDDMRDRWLRAEAEIQNVRTRAKRDVDDTRQYAVQKF